MILTDADIAAAIITNDIVIRPFDSDCIGTNSYDVRLSKWLKYFKKTARLDCKQPIDPNFVHQVEIPEAGFWLSPGTLYLGSTIEYTENPVYVPVLYGKSSLARLGLVIHQTAGFGDIGFKGHWTLELTVTHPLRVYPGQKIGQLIFFKPSSQPIISYDEKPSAKYRDQSSRPAESRFYENF